MTATLAWVAVGLGWTASWLCGRRKRVAWFVSIAAAAIWCIVNVRLRLWAGVIQAVVSSGLALRNWALWRSVDDSAAGRRDSEPREVPATDPAELAGDVGGGLEGAS